MSTCALKAKKAVDIESASHDVVEWNIRGGIVALHPKVQEYLQSRNSLRTALGQWESALRKKFAPAAVYTQVDLATDPDSNLSEIALVVAVDRPGPEARRMLDELIDEGLLPEAEAHFDEIDVVLIAA